MKRYISHIIEIAKEVRCISFLAAVLCLGLVACESDYKESGGFEFDGTIKVLVIGNSFSLDSYSYVPFLLDDILKDEMCDISIGLYHIPGGSLEDHYSNYRNASLEETDKHYGREGLPKKGKASFYLWSNKEKEKVWQHTKKTLIEALETDKWDFVVFQQMSALTSSYKTYQPYLNNLIKIAKANCLKKQVCIGFNLAHRMTMGEADFVKTCNAAKRVIFQTEAKYLFPYATALENAMRTKLRYVQFGGERMTAENYHLQEGLPCQIAAYVETEILLKLSYPDYSISGNQLRFTDEWAKGKNIPNPQGACVGSDDENSVIAQRCALMAVEKPFTLIEEEY